MITARAFAGKRYAVFGLARTGLSVVRALRASEAKVLAWDDNPEAREKVAGLSRVELVDLNSADLHGIDALVVSPGVPLNTHPLAMRAREARIPIIGDIELFAMARDELPAHKVVAITGTNGKSTTTALIHHILAVAGRPVRMGGNIGKPILGEDPLPEGGIYVLELSSFQIDLTRTLSPEVAVLLNITPDHLDRHGGMEGYAAAKARLFEMQERQANAVIAVDDDYTRAIAARPYARLTKVSAERILQEGVSVTGNHAFLNGEPFARQADWPALQGPHNAQNAAAAIAAARVLGVDNDTIRRGLSSYGGLPHRMERVAEKRGVLYVNDSKATNPTSTAPALASYPAIHWILGGRAKTDDLTACANYFANVRAAYVIGEAAPMFEKLLSPHMTVERAETLENATRLAAQAARPGEVVLLSPACASYDQFSDFEARGAAFRAAVGGLPS